MYEAIIYILIGVFLWAFLVEWFTAHEDAKKSGAVKYRKDD